MGEWGTRVRGARLRRRPLGLTVLAAGLVSVLLALGDATAFPGANGRIVFASDRDGDFDIYLMDADGSDVVQLTNDAAAETQPTWSPTGTEIAFVRGGQIWKMNPDGSGTTQLTTGSNDDAPAWSHDGDEIAYVHGDDIWKMNADGSGEAAFITTTGVDRSPAFSPDGDRVAYASNLTGNYEIHTSAPDGSGTDNISSSTGTSDTEPAWSADGDHIAFIRDGDVYRMAEDGSDQARLTTTGETESHPSWSPNGEQIAFAVLAGGNDDVYVMPAGGGPRTQLTTDPANDRHPDWGVILAFTTKPSIIAGSGAPPDPLPDGTTLTVVPTSPVNNNPGATVTNSYQWMRCDVGGANCADISGATGETYTVQSADIGKRIRVRQIATTSDGSASAVSDPTPVVAAAAPDNILPPTITPATGLTIGATVTAAPGTWSGSQPMTFAYQWQRCETTATASCVDIPSATGTTYVLRNEDLSKFMRVKVTGSNAQGSETAQSAATDQVQTAAPVNVVEPTVTGTMRVGQVASASTGTWNGVTPITFTYQWQRCNADGTGCADIPGARSSSYTIVAADAGKKLRVVITARNTAGTASASGLAADAVASSPPANSVRPAVTGLARVGSVLTSSTGTWTGAVPMTFTYQWQRCDADGENCVDIVGATGQTYIPTAADVGRTIVVKVTATNSGGTATVSSLETAAVTTTGGTTGTGGGTTTRPANTAVPRITGTPARGSLLVATPGTWTGTTPMTFSYQWQRCTTLTSCTAIARATLSTYRLVQEDVGRRIRVVVTAANGGGSAVANSATTDVVKAAAVTTAGVTRRGTAKANRLVGTAGRDVLIGLAGNDLLLGRAENDRLFGDAGNDRVSGEAGNDLEHGGSGKDKLFGGPGADNLFGDTGNDNVNGGPGRDRIRGGLGNDGVHALDGEIDDVDCGAGRDFVRADRFDRLRNCERVSRGTAKRSSSVQNARTAKKSGSAAGGSSDSLLANVLARATSWATRD